MFVHTRALTRPTLKAPPVSIHAMLPPPAPISTRSITGTMMSHPLPLIIRPEFTVPPTSNSGYPGPTLLHHANLSSRPAHVERDEILVSCEGAQVRSGDAPLCRPGFDDVDRSSPGHLGGHCLPARLHDEKVHT